MGTVDCLRINRPTREVCQYGWAGTGHSVGAKTNIGPSVYSDFPVCFCGLKLKDRKKFIFFNNNNDNNNSNLFQFSSAQYISSFICV